MNRYEVNSKSFKVSKGIEFKNEKTELVLDYLKSRKRNEIISPAYKFSVVEENDHLFLEYSNGHINRFPIREAFIIKLVNWYQIPLRIINLYELDTVLQLLNNTLRLIKGEVSVVIENGEALTIISDSYTYIEDIKLIDRCKEIGIQSITRNDFFTRFYLEQKAEHQIELKKDDVVGFGYNVMNSETGLHSFQVFAYLLRMVCSNGAIMPTDYLGKKFYHYNKNPQEAYNLIAKLPEHLSLYSIELNKQFIRAQKEQFDIDKYKDISRLNSILGFPEYKKFLDDYASKVNGSSTIFSFYDYLTEKANLYDEVTRLELQKLAGRLLIQKQSAISDQFDFE
jgi:hypothetical protein